MTAEQLKASLLQMAIQGKLVPQLDDEPPVDIDTEEPEEVLFSIPDKWKWVRLGAVLSDIEAGKSYKCIEIPPVTGQCGIVKVSAVTWGTFFQDESKTCYDNNCWKQEYAIHTHDFLISRANTADLVGSCVIVEHISKKLMLSDKILRLRFSSFIYPYFLLWVMRTKMIRYQLLQLATGTSNSMKNISQEAIKSLQIPLPPLAEQHRIVDRLNELLPIVEEYGKNQRVLQTLEKELPGKLRSSLLQQAIMGKLVPQLDDEPAVDIDSEELEDVPFAIPEKWKWVKLGTCITLKSGRDLERNKILELEEGIPYLTGASQIDNGRIIINRWTKNPTVISKKGDLLLTCKGTVGKVAINNVGDMHIARQIMAIGTNHIVSLMYTKLFMLFSSIELTRSARSMIPGISRNDVLNLPFPLPPLAEQHRIVDRMNEIFPFFDTMTDTDTLS